MDYFRKHLEATVSLAASRSLDLHLAAERIHSAVCALDHHNRALLAEHFPAFVQIAEEFGAADPMLLDDLGVEYLPACPVSIKSAELPSPDYSDWVKRLGQWHLSETGDHHTICGMPMLGNNYARDIPETEREKCPECWPSH